MKFFNLQTRSTLALLMNPCASNIIKIRLSICFVLVFFFIQIRITNAQPVDGGIPNTLPVIPLSSNAVVNVDYLGDVTGTIDDEGNLRFFSNQMHYIRGYNHGNYKSIVRKRGTNNFLALDAAGNIYLIHVALDNINIGDLTAEVDHLGVADFVTGSINWDEPDGDAIYLKGNNILGVSRDAGKTFQKDSAGLGLVTDYTLDTAQNLYAIGHGSTGPNYVYWQSSSSNSWSKVNSFPTGVSPQSIYVDRRNRIFVGTQSGGVYRSTNLGTSWTVNSSGLTGNTYGKMCDDVYGTIYMINNFGSRIYRSTDGGDNWLRIDSLITNLSATPAGSNIIRSITGDTSVVISSAFGAYITWDKGNTWVNVKGFYENSLTAYMLRPNGRLIETTTNGLFYLNASDSIWHRPLPINGYGPVGPLYADTIGTIYTRMISSIANNPYLIYKSNDNGSTWTIDTGGLSLVIKDASFFVDEFGNQHISKLASSTYPEIKIFNKVPGGSFVLDTIGFGMPSNGLYDYISAFGSDHHGNLFMSGNLTGKPGTWKRSINSGSWTPDTAGLGTNFFALMVNDKNGTMIGSPTFHNPGLFYHNATKWISIPYPAGIPSFANVRSITTDPSLGWIVAFSNYDFKSSSDIGRGVYCTHDNGSTWKYVGLDSILVNQLITFGDTTYVLSTRGIYKLTCNGVIGVAIQSSEKNIEDPLLIYPNPSKNLVNVSLDNIKESLVKISVVDLLGEKVLEQYQQTINHSLITSLDLSKIKAGCYFIIVETSDRCYVGRLMKE